MKNRVALSVLNGHLKLDVPTVTCGACEVEFAVFYFSINIGQGRVLYCPSCGHEFDPPCVQGEES